MNEIEVAFRAALHEEKFTTAAVLLAQVIEARYELQQRLTLVQILRLQAGCHTLLSQRADIGAAALLQAATDYLPQPAHSTR